MSQQRARLFITGWWPEGRQRSCAERGIRGIESDLVGFYSEFINGAWSDGKLMLLGDANVPGQEGIVPETDYLVWTDTDGDRYVAMHGRFFSKTDDGTLHAEEFGGLHTVTPEGELVSYYFMTPYDEGKGAEWVAQAMRRSIAVLPEVPRFNTELIAPSP